MNKNLRIIEKCSEVVFHGIALGSMGMMIYILWRVPESEPNVVIKVLEIILLIISFIYFFSGLIMKVYDIIKPVKGGIKNKENDRRNKETTS